MAAKTPSSIVPIRMGNRKGYVATFADIDDGDTFTVINTVTPLRYHINNTTDGVVISAVFAAGVFTFTVASAGTNKTGTLEVLL